MNIHTIDDKRVLVLYIEIPYNHSKLLSQPIKSLKKKKEQKISDVENIQKGHDS